MARPPRKTSAGSKPLAEYEAKRDFEKTSEPRGEATGTAPGWRYLIQKHDATRLHFDFRLELNGVLLSWAVTRGPSYDPAEKRLAVHVEDHPLDYGNFEGTIPKGEYGGGTVMLWDEGTWEPVGDPQAALAKGDFKFILHGERLNGKWVLVRMKPKPGEKSPRENWLLIKERDEFARLEQNPIIERALTSVRTGRTMEEIAAGDLEWSANGAQRLARSSAEKRAPRKAVASGAASRLPRFSAPQLATLTEEPPKGEAWLHEIKYDGYRAIAALGEGKVVVYTRTGLDWTDKFATLVGPLADLPCRSALLDGEIAVVGKGGHTDFGALQEAVNLKGRGISYYLFDCLEIDGEDLRDLPLVQRKERLAELLKGIPAKGPLFYSDHVVGHGAETFAEACRMGLEGIVSKRADAPYRSERAKSWLKVKCGMGQEFIIVGWEPSPVKGRPFSSILLAVREGDQLVYRGRVGSGFGDTDLARLGEAFAKRRVPSSPADGVPPDVAKTARFVRPELVAEIAFRGWSKDGLVRQGSYKGLRADKPAVEVVAEAPQPSTTSAGRSAPALVAVDSDIDRGTIEVEGVRVTHPDRVLFPGKAVTKRALIDYYRLVADRILPHVAGRPLSLVRSPTGGGGPTFFQKHASPGFPDAFKPVRIKEKDGSDIYIYIEDIRGLIASAQMGVLELHIWGSHVDKVELPDRIVFDLDPDPEVPFATLKAAAIDMRDRLAAIGLDSFVMATGGKGLHVIAPLTPRDNWEAIKVFAEAMARTMAAEAPELYLAEMSKAKRRGKIFIDYLRNGRGATAIAPFSPRARQDAPVAWPVAWSALAKLATAQPVFVSSAAETLRGLRRDPWRGYFDIAQRLPHFG
ncbi:MAG: DNA ligase D [Bauldia sp.]